MATDRKRQNKAENDDFVLPSSGASEQGRNFPFLSFGNESNLSMLTNTPGIELVYALCPCLQNKNDDDADVDTAKVNRNQFWSAQQRYS